MWNFRQFSEDFLKFSGTTTDLDLDQLSTSDTEEQIVNKILEQDGSWSIVYYQATLGLLFIGRDVFGRQSLVVNFATGDFGVMTKGDGEWVEVPFGQVTVIGKELDARFYSYLDEYPQDVCEAYFAGFRDVQKFKTDKKSELLNVSRSVVVEQKEPAELLERVVKATKNLLRKYTDSHLGVCLSGGVDSTFVTHVAHLSTSPAAHIDLINVAFGENDEAFAAAPDRSRAHAATASLRVAYPDRHFRLILVNVKSDELEEMRRLHIADAARPATSVLDDSLACVLWFAVRAKGVDAETGEPCDSPATTLLLGSGADELLAGYARHRTRFEKEKIVENVAEECENELRRLGSRNGGRDARVAAQLGKTILDSIYDIQPPELPQSQWVEAWKTWLRISRGLARQGCSALSTSMSSSTIDNKPPLSSRTSASSLASLIPPTYIPGPSHLTAILHVFPPLFNRVAKSIPVEDLKYESLPAVLESMMNVPIPSEQAPFVLPSSTTHLTPTQEALVEAVKNVYVECTLAGNTTTLRNAVPDLIRLLLRFASLATQRIATNRVAPGGQKSYRDYALTTIVPFSEYSLRMAIEFYVSTSSAHNSEEVSQISVEIIRFLAEPLHLKYTCISPSTWKLAATSLMTCLKTAIPLARQHAEQFRELWPAICDTMEKWLFTPNRSTRLAADERKRDELLECQAIEIIRAEMLAYAAILPHADVQRLIALLHRGSISQIDANDVLGLDTHTQRNELAKACFDALLMSTSSSPANGEDATDAATSTSPSTGILGNVAVASLMQRCTQVMNDFCRDFSSSGDLRLPRARTLEIVSALQAIDQLIDRLARDPRLTELYSQLVSLFPTVVEIVPCCHSDTELERQLVKTIKSYQTLFLVQKIP